MRAFNYIKDYRILDFKIRNYINCLELYINMLLKEEENELYKYGLQLIKTFKEKYPDLDKCRRLIMNDLMKEENVTYYYEHNEYSHDASKLGLQIEKDLKRIFIMEDEIKDMVVQLWKNEMTLFDDIENGEDFMFVGHASYNLPGTIEQLNYRLKSQQFLSCSLFSNNELNSFGNLKTIYVVNVDENSFISASPFDSVTGDLPYPKFETLKEININGVIHYIKVGFDILADDKIVTSILSPKIVETLSVEREMDASGEKFVYKALTNEIVLDRTKTKTIGGVLLSNGCDLLICEFLRFKRNGIKFKCINKGIYRRKNGLSSYTEEEFEEFLNKLSVFAVNADMYHFEKKKIEAEMIADMGCIDERMLEDLGFGKNSSIYDEEFLYEYYTEVILPMKYDEKIFDLLRITFSEYINIPKLKNKQI